MTAEPQSHAQTEVGDFADVLMPTDGSEPPVVVGGHAANLWGLHYLAKGVTELARFLPFTSKDLDLVGTTELLERLHRVKKGRLTLSPPRSPVLGRLENNVVRRKSPAGWSTGFPNTTPRRGSDLP